MFFSLLQFLHRNSATEIKHLNEKYLTQTCFSLIDSYHC